MSSSAFGCTERHSKESSVNFFRCEIEEQSEAQLYIHERCFLLLERRLVKQGSRQDYQQRTPPSDISGCSSPPAVGPHRHFHPDRREERAGCSALLPSPGTSQLQPPSSIIHHPSSASALTG